MRALSSFDESESFDRSTATNCSITKWGADRSKSFRTTFFTGDKFRDLVFAASWHYLMDGNHRNIVNPNSYVRSDGLPDFTRKVEAQSI